MGSFQQSYTALIRTLARRTPQTQLSGEERPFQADDTFKGNYDRRTQQSISQNMDEKMPSELRLKVEICHNSISRGASLVTWGRKQKWFHYGSRLRRCSSYGGSSAKKKQYPIVHFANGVRWWSKMKVYFREDHQAQWLWHNFLSSWLGVLHCISHKEWGLKGPCCSRRCIWLRTSLCCIQSYYYFERVVGSGRLHHTEFCRSASENCQGLLSAGRNTASPVAIAAATAPPNDNVYAITFAIDATND